MTSSGGGDYFCVGDHDLRDGLLGRQYEIARNVISSSLLIISARRASVIFNSRSVPEVAITFASEIAISETDCFGNL